MSFDVRMRRAEYDVDDVRICRHDVRECLDDIFDALVRRQQSEGQQHHFALDAEAVFVEVRINKRHIRDAVRDQVDLVRAHAVNLLQKLSPSLTQRHQPI